MRPKISNNKTHRQADHLRQNLTEVEARQWAHLSGHRLGDVHLCVSVVTLVSSLKNSSITLIYSPDSNTAVA